MAKTCYLQAKDVFHPYPYGLIISKSFSYDIKFLSPKTCFKRTFFVQRNGTVKWYGQIKDIERAGIDTTKYILNHPSYGVKLRAKFIKESIKFIKFTSTLLKKDYSKLTNKQLWKIIDKYYKEYAELYKISEPIPFACKEKITEYMGRYFSKLDRSSHTNILNILLSPTKKSHINREELELLHIALKKDKKRLIKEHTEKYCWLPYDYGVTLWKENDFKK